MAFSTTIRDGVQVKKGTRQCIVTLADTAGVSAAFNAPDAQSVTAQVEGTFGGGTVTIEVSNDGATFYPAAWLKVADATPFVGSAAGAAVVHPSLLGWRYYRLRLAGGNATSDLTVTLTIVALGGRN